MKGSTYTILIAETDGNFRRKLVGVLNELSAESFEVGFDIIEVYSLEELKIVISSTPTGLAFIDHFYFVHHEKEMAGIFNEETNQSLLVMLISGLKNEEIDNLLEPVSKYKALSVIGHILKEEYPRDLIKVLTGVFLKKLFDLKNAPAQ
ncbi:MAG: hypothetical protein ACXVPN_11900 [Bacteroidia bacterium]